LDGKHFPLTLTLSLKGRGKKSLWKKGHLLNQKSSQSPFSPGIAALSSKARNDGGMDSRLRGNDI